MARTNNLTNFLTDVATAIKTKLEDDTPIPASQFDTKIGEIETGGTYQSKTINISTNGSQTVTPDTGYDAIEQLTLNVSVPPASLQSKSYEFTTNQTMTLLPDTGYDGFSSVNAIINVTDPEYVTNLALSQQILGSSALPYIPLEYIESTGTEYINTGMYDNNGVFISSRLMFIHPEDTWNFPIGAQETVNDKVGGCNVPITAYRRPGQSITYFTFYTDTNITQTNMIVHNDALYDIYASTLINNSYMNINDTIITDTSRSNIGTKNMYIFALNNGGSPGFFSSLKLYYLQIYNSKNVLMRDFIPVKRKSDNEICLYDRVTNQFFTNQGTGDFIAGPVIN